MLSVNFVFSIAIATIHWSTFTWLERYFGVFATLGANCREHLTSGTVAIATVSVTLGFPGFATWRTALRLISIASGLEEFLFFRAESEGCPTIRTCE
jgi:hypothetical protein